MSSEIPGSFDKDQFHCDTGHTIEKYTTGLQGKVLHLSGRAVPVNVYDTAKQQKVRLYVPMSEAKRISESANQKDIELIESTFARILGVDKPEVRMHKESMLRQEASTLQNPKDMYSYAGHFEHGTNGFPYDPKLADELYRKSAERGYAPAMVFLGKSAVQLQQGFSGSFSIQMGKKAIQWFQKALKQTDSSKEECNHYIGWAMFNIGHQYEFYIGLEYEQGQPLEGIDAQNRHTEAEKWYEQAFNQEGSATLAAGKKLWNMYQLDRRALQKHKKSPLLQDQDVKAIDQQIAALDRKITALVERQNERATGQLLEGEFRLPPL